MEGIDCCFPFMQAPTRPGKPRTSGYTIVSDKSLGTFAARDLMETSADLIDYIKFTDHPTNIVRHSPEWIKGKIDFYHSHQVRTLPGGITFEVAALQGVVEPFMIRLKELGFDAVEVSEDVIPPLPAGVRYSYIKLAKEIGLEAFTEVGKKDPTAPLDVEETIDLMRKDLEAGSKKVTIENSDLALLVKIGGTDKIVQIVEAIGVEHVVFEFGPHGWPQIGAWAIRTFGPEINIENVDVARLPVVDAMRRGMNREVNYDFLSKWGGRLT